MSGLRLYFDHDSSNEAMIRELERRGHQCLSSRDAGMDRDPDPEQLAFATREGRVIVTANRNDFKRLHEELVRNGSHHAGIIIAGQYLDTRTRLRRLRTMFNLLTQEQFIDRLEFLSNWHETEQ
jgi:predicted nuclease of predicted toxin-antitoxin system